MTRRAAPGAALLHPLTLAALLTLLLNDHVLKQACPGLISGKLSDFAGVLLLPLFLHALVELAFARSGRALTPEGSERWLLAASAVTALVFALPEVWQPAEAAYRYGLGAAQWPFRAALSVLSGREAPGLRPVRATADVSDLLALPMLVVAYRVGRPSAARRR